MDADPRRGAVVPRGPSLRARLGRTLLYLCAGEKEAEEASRTDRLSWPGRGPPVPFHRGDAMQSRSPAPPSVHDRMRALHPAPFRTPAVVVAPIAAAAEKTLPRPWSPRSPRYPRGHARRRCVAARSSPSATPAPPAVADPGISRCAGGSSTMYSQPIRSRRGSWLDGDASSKVAAVVPPGDAAHGGGGSAGGREPGDGERLVILPCSPGSRGTTACRRRATGRARPPVVRPPSARGSGSTARTRSLPRLYGHAAPVFSYLPPGRPRRGGRRCGVHRRPPGTPSRRRRKSTPSRGEEEGYPAPSELVVPEAETGRRALRRPDARLRTGSRSPFGPGRSRCGGTRGGRERGDPPQHRHRLLGRAPLPAGRGGEGMVEAGDRFIVSSLSPSQVDRMEDFLPGTPCRSPGSTRCARLSRDRGASCAGRRSPGDSAPEARAAIVTESEIFGRRPERRPRKEDRRPRGVLARGPAGEPPRSTWITASGSTPRAPAAHGRRDGGLHRPRVRGRRPAVHPRGEDVRCSGT